MSGNAPHDPPLRGTAGPARWMFRALRVLWILVGAAGISAVALGAVAAHALAGLDPRLAGMLETATAYHLAHAIAAGVAAALATLDRTRPLLALAAGFGFVLGVVCFCGSLYAHAFSGGATPTALAPIGGGAFMISWLLLGIGGARSIGRIGS